ncbi:Protein of unknown function [Lactobacillus delbrueckii subsp. lactis]|nr:Protein of unknown function [Lactobacillus delbrueckii subsp. lactis]CDR85346.1 Protein of unknown function [Lactobacillus delbrueckii subsp. lactis]
MRDNCTTMLVGQEGQP